MSQNSLTAPFADKKRLGLLDSVRGICVAGMILYHTLFDVLYFFGISVSPAAATGINLVRDLGAALFILMSGFTFRLGSHRICHAVVTGAGGLVITLVTYIAARDMTVIFGILSFMCVAGVFACLTDRILSRLYQPGGAFVCLFLFFLFLSVNYGYIGYGSFALYFFPSALYKNMFTAFLGFPFPGFVSGDYFGFLPWIFAYLTGYFLFGSVYGSDKFTRLSHLRIPVAEKLGKYSLYIYLGHQPVIYGTVYALSRLIK